MKESVRGKGQDEENVLPKHFWGQVLQHSPCASHSRTRKGNTKISFNTMAILITTLTPPTSGTEADP